MQNDIDLEKRKLKYTSISSVLLQTIWLLYGFIIPHLILLNYGSETNGLISSVSKFLMVISLMDLGVSEVVRTAFYRPLINNDSCELSQVYVASTKFFRTIALFLCVYTIALCVIYPKTVNSFFHIQDIVSIIIVMSISSFAQYFFGISNSLLLDADQRGYIRYNTQIVITIVDLFIAIVLIRSGTSIQIVKLCSALIFSLKPIFLEYYVKKTYKINKRIKIDLEPIKQKWNGFAQHLSTFIMDYVDIMILTIMSTLSDVSVYSVYHMVLMSIYGVFISLFVGVKSLLGKKWVKEGHTNEYCIQYRYIEWCIHTVSIFSFGCSSVLIVPFVSLYTEGMIDANYIQPVFGILLTIAFTISVWRLPASMMIQAAGRYRETQMYYYGCALINILVSVLSVNKYGINGVAFGTITAMLTQTIITSIYCYKKILSIRVSNLLKQLIIDTAAFVFGYVIVSRVLQLNPCDYISWIVLAFKVMVIWGLLIIVINMLFYRDNVTKTFGKLIEKIQ